MHKIELSPVRASMVNDPADYVWSSYQSNALGKGRQMLTPHQFYFDLGENDDERQEQYRLLFEHEVTEDLIKEIRDATNKRLAVGSEKFKKEIEENYSRRLNPAKGGRPKRVKEI